jgi:hypothetical protein
MQQQRIGEECGGVLLLLLLLLLPRPGTSGAAANAEAGAMKSIGQWWIGLDESSWLVLLLPDF